MKRNTWIGLTILLLVFTTNCHKGTNNTLLQQKGKEQTEMLQLLQQIDSLGDIGEIDAVVIKDFIEKANTFSAAYPEDPMAAEFLYRAALMAMTVAKASDDTGVTVLYSKKALLIFDDIQMIYPDFGGIKNCILNKGVVYEDILQDYVNAEIFYREFIARYPADTLAVNLEAYLPYLGKSPEEVMLEVVKK